MTDTDSSGTAVPPTPKATPGRELAVRSPAWHHLCCQRHRIEVSYDPVGAPYVDGWWRSVARGADGSVRFATGGATRLWAETNCLNGLSVPMQNPGNAPRGGFGAALFGHSEGEYLPESVGKAP